MVGITRDLPIGHQFPPITKPMTKERMAVFSDMEHSTCVGYFQLAPPNIHNDLEFAQNEGFPALVADGLITTHWVEAVMRDLFGVGYYKGGKLVTKYIRPVYADDEVTIKLVLKEKVPEGDTVRFNLEISCVNQKDELVTFGTASALVS
ncbi:MaoC family dehydratase [Chloroflexota bacterium]